MHLGSWRPQTVLVGALAVSATISLAAETEKVRNDKVVAWEEDLKPGEKIAVSGAKPALILYLVGGTLEVTRPAETPITVETKSGTVQFESSGIQAARNGGSFPLRILRVEFSGQGSPEHWGAAGLSSHYKVLLENNYVRVYDIFIPAASNEPQHTHKDRIVVCLSGAELTHLFPDGKAEVSTLKTGEVVWRKGSTHIGQNHSANDFRAIAIEPK
jgi:hypothetical protein